MESKVPEKVTPPSPGSLVRSLRTARQRVTTGPQSPRARETTPERALGHGPPLLRSVPTACAARPEPSSAFRRSSRPNAVKRAWLFFSMASDRPPNSAATSVVSNACASSRRRPAFGFSAPEGPVRQAPVAVHDPQLRQNDASNLLLRQTDPTPEWHSCALPGAYRAWNRTRWNKTALSLATSSEWLSSVTATSCAGSSPNMSR